MALGARVICFGGSDRKPQVYDDVWYLDVSGKELEWVKVTPSYKNCKITPRSGASLTAINGKVRGSASLRESLPLLKPLTNAALSLRRPGANV